MLRLISRAPPKANFSISLKTDEKLAYPSKAKQLHYLLCLGMKSIFRLIGAACAIVA